MKIVILGAGRVGESVAESLVSEKNDITVIDPDPARLRPLQDRLDLRGVVGNGIQPSVLEQAGVADALDQARALKEVEGVAELYRRQKRTAARLAELQRRRHQGHRTDGPSIPG